MRPLNRQLRWGVPILLAAGLCSVASPVRAQWVDNGLHLSRRQSYPLPVPAPNGGAYVVTADWLTSGMTGDGVRLLHLDVGGFVAPGWPAAGIPIAQTATRNDTQYWCDASPVADGAVTVALRQEADNRILLTRIRPDGTPVPGWDPAFQAAPGVSSQDLAQICPTPDGGNFVIWQAGGLSSWDVWMTRLTADGLTAPGWPAAGHEVGAGPGMQFATSPVIPDGADGAWLAYFSTGGGTDADVFVLRTDAYGNPAPGFPLYGRTITSVPGAQAQPWLCRDGGDGIYVVWCDARSCPGTPDPDLQYCYDIYLQHLTGTGEVAPGWPADGLPVCIWPDSQQEPKLLADGSGGVYVGWDLSGPQGATVHVQHILADASVAPGWPAGGKRAFGVDAYTNIHKLATDQLGGVFVTAEVLDVGSQWRVYVQHLTYGGGFDAAWSAMGLPVVGGFDGHDRTSPRLCPSLPGSVIVCWNDARSGSDEVYAARVTLDGVVATAVSLLSQDATAERVALAWGASGDALASATVERRREDEDWSPLATISSDGTGTLRYEDRDISPGVRYAYRLTWPEGGELRHTSEAWVTVPLAARFALAGASPNPSPRAELRVAFSLAEPGAARLELFDAQGRSVARHDVGATGPGAHAERFGEARSLRAGLYWLRLTQGASAATARVVLVD